LERNLPIGYPNMFWVEDKTMKSKNQKRADRVARREARRAFLVALYPNCHIAPMLLAELGAGPCDTMAVREFYQGEIAAVRSATHSNLTTRSGREWDAREAACKVLAQRGIRQDKILGIKPTDRDWEWS
jgi:hypothetical protein